eukprot:gb/GEZN01014966.1/.p1 GENE.gb/GEZN01014966.1/~~gb/GEZN01014966.1/.p1  ORF type:complete len:196 (-),score=28.11 gb/GEZN01014966.1/:255-842(-)
MSLLLFGSFFWSICWASALIDLDDSDFDEMVKGRDSFVTFFAPWCGQCKKFHPVNEQLAEEFDESLLLVAQVDCTLNPTKCSQIQAYPTLKYYRNGMELDQYNGARDLENLRQWIQKLNPKLKTTPTKTVPQTVLTSSFHEAWSQAVLGISVNELNDAPIFLSIAAQHPFMLLACVYFSGLFFGLFLGLLYRIGS